MERPEAGEPGVTGDALEHERLRTYVDWAEVDAPVWYWPALAVVITAWIGGYGLGRVVGALGALLVVGFTIVGLRTMANRGQVSTPRFRGMPSSLKRAHLPAVFGAAWLVGTLLFVAVADSAPYLVLGASSGVVMALGGAWSSRRYRIAARRLADEAGIGR